MHIADIGKCAAVHKSKGCVQKKKGEKKTYKKHSNPYLLLQEVNIIWQRKKGRGQLVVNSGSLMKCMMGHMMHTNVEVGCMKR